ncbi:MAG: TIGR04255 family protein [Acidobacteriaceae bacterium]
MKPALHLSHAPIVEAVIGINVEMLPSSYLPELKKIFAGFDENYLAPEPTKSQKFQVDVRVDPAVMSHQEDDLGFRAFSKDRKRLLQLNRNGFLFSRLAPYDRWGTFRDEAKELWKSYRTVAGFAAITEFGLRYVNRLSIPVGQPIERFLKVYPEVPSDSNERPRNMNACFMRLQLELDDPHGLAIIQEIMLPPERPEVATLALDIDLRFQRPVPSDGDEAVWGTLELARHAKNELFVQFLTPEFMRTFE